MMMNIDVNSLNMIIDYCNKLNEGKKSIEEYYDDVLKELLIIRGMNE